MPIKLLAWQVMFKTHKMKKHPMLVQLCCSFNIDTLMTYHHGTSMIQSDIQENTSTIAPTTLYTRKWLVN